MFRKKAVMYEGVEREDVQVKGGDAQVGGGGKSKEEEETSKSVVCRQPNQRRAEKDDKKLAIRMRRWLSSTTR